MQKGLTAIELLVTMTVLFLLLSIATPDIKKLHLRSAVDTQARSLLHMLNKTREETVINGVNATFCGIDANNQCQQGVSTTFVVFIDGNRNRQLDENEQLIYTMEQAFKGKIDVTAANGSFIAFQTSGVTTQAGHIILCPSVHTESAARKLSLNFGGRSYMVRSTPAKRRAWVEECETI